MFLSKKTYVQRWEHIPKERQFSVSVKRGGKAYKPVQPKRISYIVEEVAYWRKFNALHGWFVDNCQDGRDKCQEAYVDRDQIEEILSILKQVDAYHVLAEDLLPQRQGFFFGSIEYDEWYFTQVKESIKIFEKLLEEENSDEFYYRSSW